MTGECRWFCVATDRLGTHFHQIKEQDGDVRKDMNCGKFLMEHARECGVEDVPGMWNFGWESC